MCFPALFEAPAIFHGAVAEPLPPAPPLVLGEHLAVVPRVPGQAPTLVHPPTLTPIQTGHYALAELTSRPIEPCLTLARVLLYAFPPVLARGLTDATLTTASLEACRAVTNPWSRAGSPVHTLGRAHRDRAGGSFPSWSAGTPTTSITLPTVVTLPLTVRVRAQRQALLPSTW